MNDDGESLCVSFDDLSTRDVVGPPFGAFDPGATGTWFVIHTKSRQEKALAEDLVRLRVPHFLPTSRRQRRHGRRRTVVVDVPLFPGYLFVRGTLDQVYRADRTKRVANILRVLDQARMDWELQNLSRAVGCQGSLDPYPYLSVGRRVEVRSGPFRGLQGFVSDRMGANRLFLTVNVLGRAVGLEVDGSALEPVDG